MSKNIKGEPDFSTTSDDLLLEIRSSVQKLLFIYQFLSKDRLNLLESIWKDVDNETIERACGIKKPRQIKLVKLKSKGI